MSKVRGLKVGDGYHRKAKQPHPVIRMRGNYLARWGFGIGDTVSVQIEHGKITITKAC